MLFQIVYLISIKKLNFIYKYYLLKVRCIVN
jgi:hypothetical protein